MEAENIYQGITQHAFDSYYSRSNITHCLWNVGQCCPIVIMYGHNIMTRYWRTVFITATQPDIFVYSIQPTSQVPGISFWVWDVLYCKCTYSSSTKQLTLHCTPVVLENIAGNVFFMQASNSNCNNKKCDSRIYRIGEIKGLVLIILVHLSLTTPLILIPMVCSSFLPLTL